MAGPLVPPVGTRFSTGEDIALLSGPSVAPSGAMVVDPAVLDGINIATAGNPPGTTFYLLGGVHFLGTTPPGPFNQCIPKTGNTYIGAPGAIIDGRSVNRYAFTGSNTGITLKYLEIRNFVSPIDELTINHDASDGYTIQFCNIHHNAGGAIGLGSGIVIDHCWLHDNSQYGFSASKGPTGNASTAAIVGVLIDHCEFAYNGTVSDEVNPSTGQPTGNGRNGAGKFWNTESFTVSNCWLHNSNWVALWADTNNNVCLVENNLIDSNNAMGFLYEISYNFMVRNNTFRRNAIMMGAARARFGDQFPISAMYLSESGGDAAANATYALSSVEGNTFINNWDDITLWENPDRFCNSLANTSWKIYKPLGHGATLALCNNPVAKVLTASTTSGSASITITSGALESTDEGRAISGAGIPAGAKLLEPFVPDPGVGVVSPTQGTMSAPATVTATGVTVTLAAGGINTEPGYSACRWHTQNIRVQGNTFSHDHASVVAGEAGLPAGTKTGKISLISQFGSFPAWSPYTGFIIEDQITLSQNNLWLNNAYAGDFFWQVREPLTFVTFAQWRASPYGQDSGSTYTTVPGNPDPPTVGNPLWANSGAGKVAVTDIYAVSGSGSRVKVVGRN